MHKKGHHLCKQGHRRYQTSLPILPPGGSLWISLYALLASPLPGRLWANMHCIVFLLSFYFISLLHYLAIQPSRRGCKSVLTKSVVNTTSTTKPEIHNVLHCLQRTTEPRPQSMCTGNVVKFGRVVLRNASAQTYRQTRSSQYFALLPRMK